MDNVAEQIGDLTELETTEKSNLVGVINEVLGDVPQVDDTLSVTGAAADAKKTGDEISELNERFDSVTEVVGHETVEKHEYVPITLGIADYTITEHGITITQDSNGTVSIAGTPDTNVSFPLRNANGYLSVSLEANKTYKLSGCPTGGSITKYGLDLRKSAIGNIVYVDYGNGKEFTLDESGTYYPHIRVISGNVLDLLFTPVIAERVTVQAEVDVYSAKDTVARDDIDQINEELDNIAQGSFPNRNLIHFTDAVTEINNATITQNEKTGEISVSGNANANVLYPVVDGNGYCAVNVKQGNYYTLSGADRNDEGGSHYFLALCKTVGGTMEHTDYAFPTGRTFIPETDETLYLHVRLTNGYGNGAVFKPQIEEWTSPTEFIPYSDKSSRDDIARFDNDKNSSDVENSVMDGDIVNAMLNCARTYIAQNATVQYGQRTAIHWFENGVNYTKDRLFDNKSSYTPTEIDCSSFALLVLGGIPYEGSKYVGDINYFGMCGYCFDIFHGDETARPSGGAQTLTHNMAKWFEDSGIGFEPAEDGCDLLPGDVLFFSYPHLMQSNYRGIGHCEIFCHKETNFPINYKEPTLITIGSDDNANASVQCYARPYSWWNGTDATGRKLAYVGRPKLQSVKNKNKVVSAKLDYYANSALYGYPFKADRYTPITIEFDGILNSVGGYFEVSFDRTIVLTTMPIESGLVGVEKHYKMVIPSTAGNLNLVRVVARGSNNTSAKIKNIKYADGLNF